MKLLTIVEASVAIFVLLTVLARLMGKKLLAQMTFYDFAVGVTIGTIAGSFVANLGKGLIVLVSPVVLAALSIALGFATLKSITLRKLVNGEPVVVVQNGKVLERNMARARYTSDNLLMQLREKNVFNLADVEFAVLEPHGELSVEKVSQKKPVTSADLGIATSYQGMSTELIRDGDIMEQNLRQNSLDFSWLYRELRKQGVNDVQEVFLATLGTDGTLYVDRRDDKLEYVQKVEDTP